MANSKDPFIFKDTKRQVDNILGAVHAQDPANAKRRGVRGPFKPGGVRVVITDLDSGMQIAEDPPDADLDELHKQVGSVLAMMVMTGQHDDILALLSQATLYLDKIDFMKALSTGLLKSSEIQNALLNSARQNIKGSRISLENWPPAGVVPLMALEEGEETIPFPDHSKEGY